MSVALVYDFENCASLGAANDNTSHLRLSSRQSNIIRFHPHARCAFGAPPPSNRWRATPRLGSPQVGTNEAGAVSFTERYTPFGEALLSPSANDNQSGFTGHIKDKSTGLNYMQARYYDPNIGRFLSIDPVTFMDTGDPRYFNRYSYTANDPVNLVDPDGRQMSDQVFRSAVTSERLATSGLSDTQIGLQSTVEAGVMLGGGLFGLGASSLVGGGAAGLIGPAEFAAGMVPGMEGATLTGSMGAGGLKLLESSGVANATGDIVSTVLDKATTVFRVHGGTSSQIGEFVSPTPLTSSAQATADLALHPGNTASTMSTLQIPAGTRVQTSTAAPAFGQPGGGQQMQLLEHADIKVLDEQPLR